MNRRDVLKTGSALALAGFSGCLTRSEEVTVESVNNTNKDIDSNIRLFVDGELIDVFRAEIETNSSSKIAERVEIKRFTPLSKGSKMRLDVEANVGDKSVAGSREWSLEQECQLNSIANITENSVVITPYCQ